MTEKNHNAVALVDAVAPKTLMHPLVERMLTRDNTPEALREILALQREYQKDEAKRAFDAALVELKRVLPHFLKHDKAVEFGGKVQYTHTTLAGAMDIVTPMLVDHGFSVSWTSESVGKDVKVTCELTHRLGHTKTSTLTGPPDTSGHKNPAQAIASTVTIFERYTALGMLGLSTKDMGEATKGGAPEVASEQVDTPRNMKAMSAMAKHGKNKAEVEKFLGKPLPQWTAKDLEKLRTWIKPAAPVDTITPEQAEELRELVVRWELTPVQFGELLMTEIGRKPETANDVRKSEYAKIKALFEGLELGAFNLVNGKIERPPEADAAEAPVTFEAEMPEDKDIPF